jgi:cytochrome c oxidase cbb3-type subunit 3
LLLTTLCTLACDRERRHLEELAPSAIPAERTVRVSPLRPGAREPAPPPPGPYDENAYAISQGQHLYEQLNCVGCHGRGGGGMGPALMDNDWRYGSAPENVYASILEGRPNGMPAFAGKLPAQQAWQLVAYVRSMSGLTRPDVTPGRSDDLATIPASPAMLDQGEHAQPRGETTEAVEHAR